LKETQCFCGFEAPKSIPFVFIGVYITMARADFYFQYV